MSSSFPPWPVDLPDPLLEREHDIEGRLETTLMDSGRKRTRRKIFSPQEILKATWNFTNDQYETFKDFFDNDLSNGASYYTFLTYIAFFIGAEYSLQREDGKFTITASLMLDSSDDLEGPPSTIKTLAGASHGSTVCVGALQSLANIAFPLKLFNGPIYATLATGRVLYVVGRFTQYGSSGGGWSNCLGIARILENGNLDTTFQPGGVAGGGFNITGGFFAPTQLQETLDGGVFCGMSFAELPEPLLYDRRSASTITDQLSLNGSAVPPLIKLHSNGTRDTSFVTSYLVGSSTNPRFNSFHIFEAASRVFLSYLVDVDCTEEAGVFDLSGSNFPVIEVRDLPGNFIRRAFRTTDFGITGASYDSTVLVFQQVSFDLEVGILAWSGQDVNSADGGLVISAPNDPTIGKPVAWRCADLNLPDAFPGLFCFDANLNFLESSHWAGYTKAGAEADQVTRMVPGNITRGCFKGSVVGSERMVGDFGTRPEEGSWASSARCQHKGCLHFNFAQAYDYASMQFYSGHGNGNIPIVWTEEAGWRGYGTYSFGPSSVSFELHYHYKVEDEDDLVTAAAGGEFQASIPIYTLGKDNNFTVACLDETTFDEITAAEWELFIPSWKPFEPASTHLWDLRSGAPANETFNHGFDPFSGSTVDSDGASNIRVLKALYDGSRTHADSGTSPYLGIFLAGHIEKFKGEIKLTVKEQLIKVRHDGEWDDFFIPPELGPLDITLKTNISSGSDETHHNKINDLAFSPGGKLAYVGGKFTTAVQDSLVYQVGHLICIDVNTGRRLS